MAEERRPLTAEQQFEGLLEKIFIARANAFDTTQERFSERQNFLAREQIKDLQLEVPIPPLSERSKALNGTIKKTEKEVSEIKAKIARAEGFSDKKQAKKQIAKLGREKCAASCAAAQAKLAAIPQDEFPHKPLYLAFAQAQVNYYQRLLSVRDAQLGNVNVADLDALIGLLLADQVNMYKAELELKRAERDVAIQEFKAEKATQTLALRQAERDAIVAMSEVRYPRKQFYVALAEVQVVLAKARANPEKTLEQILTSQLAVHRVALEAAKANRPDSDCAEEEAALADAEQQRVIAAELRVLAEAGNRGLKAQELIQQLKAHFEGVQLSEENASEKVKKAILTFILYRIRELGIKRLSFLNEKREHQEIIKFTIRCFNEIRTEIFPTRQFTPITISPNDVQTIFNDLHKGFRPASTTCKNGEDVIVGATSNIVAGPFAEIHERTHFELMRQKLPAEFTKLEGREQEDVLEIVFAELSAKTKASGEAQTLPCIFTIGKQKAGAEGFHFALLNKSSEDICSYYVIVEEGRIKCEVLTKETEIKTGGFVILASQNARQQIEMLTLDDIEDKTAYDISQAISSETFAAGFKSNVSIAVVSVEEGNMASISVGKSGREFSREFKKDDLLKNIVISNSHSALRDVRVKECDVYLGKKLKDFKNMVGDELKDQVDAFSGGMGLIAFLHEKADHFSREGDKNKAAKRNLLAQKYDGMKKLRDLVGNEAVGVQIEPQEIRRRNIAFTASFVTKNPKTKKSILDTVSTQADSAVIQFIKKVLPFVLILPWIFLMSQSLVRYGRFDYSTATGERVGKKMLRPAMTHVPEPERLSVTSAQSRR